jgi:hypothetical protein
MSEVNPDSIYAGLESSENEDSKIEDSSDKYLIPRKDKIFQKQSTLLKIKRKETKYISGELTDATFRAVKTFKIDDLLKNDFPEVTKPHNKIICSLGNVGYVIEVKANGKTWRICKRQLGFIELHEKIEKEMESKLRVNGEKFYGLTMAANCPELNEDDQDSMQKALEYHTEYLSHLVKDKMSRDTSAFLEFCEVSNTSFNLKG